jgi:hypothetical protein
MDRVFSIFSNAARRAGFGVEDTAPLDPPTPTLVSEGTAETVEDAGSVRSDREQSVAEKSRAAHDKVSQR